MGIIKGRFDRLLKIWNWAVWLVIPNESLFSYAASVISNLQHFICILALYKFFSNWVEGFSTWTNWELSLAKENVEFHTRGNNCSPDRGSIFSHQFIVLIPLELPFQCYWNIPRSQKFAILLLDLQLIGQCVG